MATEISEVSKVLKIPEVLEISETLERSKEPERSERLEDSEDSEMSDYNKSKISEREYVRRMFYKNPVKKDNFKLEDWDSSQEERRKFLLEHQKRCREQNFNAARGILSYLSELKYKDKIQEKWNYEDEDEDEDEDEEDEDEDEDEDYKEIKDDKESEDYEDDKYYEDYTKCKISHKYRKMMLSEWMVVVPEDLVKNWIMVPCPVGKRTRLISGLGKTRAYTKYGDLCGVFYSALPGGNPRRYPNSSHAFQYAVLDCIWIKTKQVYYVLDVLFWSTLPFTDCEVDCRQYWLKSKLAEIENLQDRDTDANTYPILPLPSINCNSNLTAALENLDPELFPLDGLLFYHRAASYTFRKTPLVTWLKSYMLPEKLGIFVPPPLDEHPNDYINFENFIEQRNAKRNQKWKRIFTIDTKDVKGDKMEIEDEKIEVEDRKVEIEDKKGNEKKEIENKKDRKRKRD